jgi:antitoxin ParD1/3/4
MCSDEPIGDVQRLRADERLEALLIEGLESDEPVDMTKQDWEDIRSEALARLKQRRSSRPHR